MQSKIHPFTIWLCLSTPTDSSNSFLKYNVDMSKDPFLPPVRG